MSEFHKLPSFGELEHSNVWGFGDAFEILCNDATILAKSFDEGTTEFNDVFKSLMDVWAAIEDSIRRGKIRIESGKLIDLSEGLMQVSNPNVVVINKNDFLSFYRKNKNKLAQYLSYADLKIYQEEFLDRLAKAEPTQSPHPKTIKAKMNQLREDYISAVTKKLKANPNLQYPDIKDDYLLLKLIRVSDLLEDKRPKDSTLQKWLRDTRKKVKVKPKYGARKKIK
jgi:hypothetical protein